MLHRLNAHAARDAVAALAGAAPVTGAKLSRREFLKATGLAGGGLMLSFGAADANTADGKFAYPPTAFVRIARDSTVTVIINKLEFGQGVFTSMAMLIAEELDCDWTKVRAEHAPAAQIYAHPGFGIQMTGGSQSIATSYTQYRIIGATTRDMLLAAASKRWGVPTDKLDTRNGEVREQGGQRRRASYGELADEAMKLPVPATGRIKDDPLDFKLIGKPTRRIDAREKVNGTALFGIDFKLPNMKVAVVARPPVFGGRVQAFDGAKAKAIKGVDAVLPVPVDLDGNGVAVIGSGYWPVKQGRDALEIVWVPTSGPTTSEQVKQYKALAQQPGLPARAGGGADAMATAARTLTAEYEFPYLAHAPMEPLNVVVDLKADSLKLWCGSQFQTVDQLLAAQTAGLKPEQVELTTLIAGGGFGRRANSTSDYIVEAVNVAKAMKAAGIDAPVKVIWSREDDIKGGYYRPLHVHRAQIGLDAKGRPLAWNHTIVGQSIVKGTAFEKVLVKDGVDALSTEGVVDSPYTLPNLRVSVHHPDVKVPVLWWRSVGHTHTAYVMETLIDELAVAAGQDPIAYRLSLLDAKHARHRAALTLARDKSGWGKPLFDRLKKQGRAAGVAVHESFGSVCAQVAEVSVTDGAIRVHRVTAAVDCGTAVNPLSIEAQIQSAIVYGLTAALYGKITLANGVVEQSNFGDYPMLRINEMPEVAVHIVPSRAAPTGIGEPGTPPIAPAVANAVAALTGKRLRVLPFDLKSA